jgi:hypothetical protein
MKKYIVPLTMIIMLYIGVALINAGFVYADLDSKHGKSLCLAREHRGNLAFSIGWSLLPFTTVITPFVTGFYYNGWRLTSRYRTCD